MPAAVPLTCTDGERASTGKEGATATCALKAVIVCWHLPAGGCSMQGLPGRRSEDGRSHSSCIAAIIRERAVAVKEETTRISDQ